MCKTVVCVSKKKEMNGVRSSQQAVETVLTTDLTTDVKEQMR